MTEKQHDENWVKKKIKAWLDAQQAWHFPIPANGMGTSGVPDRIAVFPGGLFVAIEAKRPGRRNEANRGCSALQVRALELIAMKGGIGWVVDGDEDLEALMLAVKSNKFNPDTEFIRINAPDMNKKYASFNANTNLTLDYWKKK